jgi:hypothetical protein
MKVGRDVTDEQRSRRPIFNATRKAAAKPKGFRRRCTSFFRIRALINLEVLLFKDSMKNLLFNERKDSLRHPIV